MSRHFMLFVGVLAFVAASGASSLAAEAPEQREAGAQERREAAYLLPAITVTAQKREENVQEVPSSVGVITGEIVEEKRIREFQALSHMVPNLDIGGAGGPTYTYLGIRGRANTSSDIDPTVTVLVDGVPYGDFFSMSALPLFDVERVEVLRGPQSTLYGMNSEAGVISIVTRQPGKTPRFTFGGELADGREADGNWSLRGSASGPVIPDILSLGVAFTGSQMGSYISNEADGPAEYGRSDSKAFRFSAVLTPSDMFDATLHVGYSHAEAQDGYIALAVDDAAARAIGQDGRNKWHDNVDFNEHSEVETLSGDLTMRLKTSLADLISVTTLRKTDQLYSIDADHGMDLAPMMGLPPGFLPGVGQYGIMDNELSSFSQELRLQSPTDNDSPFEWMIGGFYHQMERDFKMSMVATVDGAKESVIMIPYPPFGSIPYPYPETAYVDGRLRGWSYALFGQGTYRLFDRRLGLTVGLRQEWTKRSWKDDNHYVTDEEMSKNDSQFLPKFSVDFRLTPENMVYASVAKGWRPGGIYPNAIPNSNPFVPAPPLTEGDLRYKRETSWTYELGTKNEFFDKRLLLNAAVFYSVYKDFQDRYQDSWLSSFLRNADEVRMAGFEVEAEGRITDGLTASLAFGYTHARYEDYKDAANDYSGNTVAFVPEYNGSFAVKYAFLDGFYVRPEVRLTGETYWDRANRHSQDAYLTLHARAGYAAEHWEVYVYGDNLTNKYAFTHAEDALGTGEMYGSPMRPLTVGVGFSVNF